MPPPMRPDRPQALRRPVALLLLGALLAVYSVLAVRQMAIVGLTVDEPTYFNTGRIILASGWEHPITRLHGPLPYYANQLFAGDFPAGGFERAEDPARLVLRGRLGTLPFGWLAVIVVYLWSARVFGRGGGLVSAALFALNPLMIGYQGLLATDMVHSGAVILCLWLAWRAVLAPGAGRALAAGAGLGVAFATKYLALLVGPVVVVLVAARAFVVARGEPAPGPRTGAALARAAGHGLLVTAAALVVLHASYGFRVGPASLDPGDYRSELVARLVGTPVVGPALALFPAPYLAGVDFQMEVGEGAHYTPYLNGRFAPRHATYYLWAFLLKTPELVLALTAWLLVQRLPRWLAGRGSLEERALAWTLLPPMAIALVYLSFLTGLQIGIRYVLPLYPMLFVLLGAVATAAWPRRLGARGRAAAALVLVLFHGVELARSWPNLLGYLNTLAGGQGRAYLHFNDSNADWGQLATAGLRELERTEELPFEVLSPFAGPRFGRVAIELRHLVQPDPEDLSRLRHWLLVLEPARYVGAAWWLFEATPEAFEQAVERAGDERARADLVVAHAGAGDLEAARRHLALLPPERAAPLAELLRLAETAAGDGAGREELLDAVAAWEAVGRFDRAEHLLRGRPELQGLPNHAHLLARALTKQGRLAEAIEVLEGQADLTAAGAPGLLLLTELYVRTNRHRDAVLVLERAAARAGGLPEPVERRLADLRVEAEQRERYYEALR